MKKLLPIFVLAFLIVSPIASASVNSYCQDNTTLIDERVTTYCEDGECEDIEINQTEVCEYGCLEGETEGAARCKNPPWITHLIVVSIILTLAFVGYYLMA